MPAASLLFQPWPVADPRQLIGLAWITVGMLLLPKLLPLLLALASPRAPARRSAAGCGCCAATLAEIVFSVLLAPLLMVQHSKAVLGILLGRGVTWTAQQRDGESESWGAVAATLRRHHARSACSGRRWPSWSRPICCSG